MVERKRREMEVSRTSHSSSSESVFSLDRVKGVRSKDPRLRRCSQLNPKIIVYDNPTIAVVFVHSGDWLVERYAGAGAAREQAQKGIEQTTPARSAPNGAFRI